MKNYKEQLQELDLLYKLELIRKLKFENDRNMKKLKTVGVNTELRRLNRDLLKPREV